MPLKSALTKSKQKPIIYLTFLLILSLPLVIFGIAQENFDIRRRAFQDLELSDEYQCLISFPHVNPYSLEKDSTITVQVDARIKDDFAKELNIYDIDGEIIHSEIFEGSPIEFATSFTYSPRTSGKADMTGVVTKGQEGIVECEITSPYNIQGLQILPQNKAPKFLSKPSESIPSQNIETGDMYEYTLNAKDMEGDNISFTYSFTPRADWLKPTVIEDGSGGNLTIKFRGSTTKPASYLAHVLIHDGYSKNVRSQSWVINVSPKENDIPVVTIIDPIESIRIDRGVTFRTSWESVDLNHILGHELFITNNPTNEDTWIPIDKDIPYNQNDYNIDTSDLRPGTYKVIVRSTDNQDPPASGIGISPEIVVSAITDIDDKEEEKDDEVILKQPQIVNVSPSSTDEVSNRLVTVRATLMASEGAKIDDETITFKLNDRDLSDNIRLNRITEREYTIIYQPEKELDEGLHKAEVIFKDSEGQEVSRLWNFMITSDRETEDDIYTIFGYDIPRNIVIIVGIGLLTVILALAIPFIIFSIWKGDKRRDDGEPYQNDRLPPSTPKDDTQYVQVSTEEPEYLKDKVKTKKEVYGKEEKKEEDVWDMYSAPKPEEEEEDDDEVEVEKVQKEEKRAKETPKPVKPTQPQKQVAPPPPPPPQQPVIQPKTPKAEEPTQPQQPQVPSTPVLQKQTPTEPEIPEPEIPDAEELEKIFNQIQQQKAEETKVEKK
jgi:hypothetical protein